MSIELPEAYILAKQMTAVLIGKKIDSYHLKEYERLQKVSFLNKNISEFDKLIQNKILSIISRGNTILVKVENEINLLIAPEYGGIISFHEDKKTLTDKYHLKIAFEDNTFFTVRIKSMGCIYIVKDEDLDKQYMYKRDFSNLLSPLENDFTKDHFIDLVKANKRNMKSILVGKDAILVGISNSAFQDILYRAKIHPKKKGSELNDLQLTSLYNSIKDLITERIAKNGKNKFKDLYGRKGDYEPEMGPNRKGDICTECNKKIDKINVGGGQIYYCPNCQNLID